MMPAGVAAAVGIGRVVVLRVSRIAYVQTSLAREELSIARVASREHAIEHVHSSRHALDKILRCPRAHEISRLRHGKSSCRLSDDLVHEVNRFPNAQPADRVSLESDRGGRISTLAAEIREYTTLHDAELSLTRIADDDVGHGR